MALWLRIHSPILKARFLGPTAITIFFFSVYSDLTYLHFQLTEHLSWPSKAQSIVSFPFPEAISLSLKILLVISLISFLLCK
jgi:hypothetical protein